MPGGLLSPIGILLDPGNCSDKQKYNVLRLEGGQFWTPTHKWHRLRQGHQKQKKGRVANKKSDLSKVDFIALSFCPRLRGIFSLKCLRCYLLPGPSSFFAKSLNPILSYEFDSIMCAESRSGFQSYRSVERFSCLVDISGRRNIAYPLQNN